MDNKFPSNIPTNITNRSYILEDGCWIFCGAINKGGYGVVQYDGNIELVHRVVAHIIYNMDINGKLFSLHKCRKRNCWNPDHLYVGDKSNNVQDSIKDGTFYSPWDQNKNNTHCINGHEFDSLNTYKRPDGRRSCKICRNNAVIRHKNKNIEIRKIWLKLRSL